MTIPPAIPPTIAPIGDLLSVDELCCVMGFSPRGTAGGSNNGIFVGDVVVWGRVGTGNVVVGMPTGTGTDIDVGTVAGAAINDGTATGAGTNTGTGADTVGAVGTRSMAKHPSYVSCSQYSSVTMATSGITSASAADEPMGNEADVLHTYRSPSNP